MDSEKGNTSDTKVETNIYIQKTGSPLILPKVVIELYGAANGSLSCWGAEMNFGNRPFKPKFPIPRTKPLLQLKRKWKEAYELHLFIKLIKIFSTDRW